MDESDFLVAWKDKIEEVRQEIDAAKAKVEAVQKAIHQKFIIFPSNDWKSFELHEILAQIIESQSEIWNLYTGYDLDTTQVNKENLLANLKKQAKALNKVLKRLHSILASLESRRTDTPVVTSKFFIEDNKLPAPTDEEHKRERLPISIAEDLATTLDLIDKEMAVVLTISIRTYHRLKLNGLLNPVASERLLLLKEIAAYGLEVFEDQSNFNQWLRLPLRDLGNSSPLNSLDSATGFNRVKTILSRIEYGVYS